MWECFMEERRTARRWEEQKSWGELMTQAKSLIADIQSQLALSGAMERFGDLGDSFHNARMFLSKDMQEMRSFRTIDGVIHFSKTITTQEDLSPITPASTHADYNKGWLLTTQSSIGWSPLVAKFYYYEEQIYTPFDKKKSPKDIDRYKKTTVLDPTEIPVEMALWILKNMQREMIRYKEHCDSVPAWVTASID